MGKTTHILIQINWKDVTDNNKFLCRLRAVQIPIFDYIHCDNGSQHTADILMYVCVYHLMNGKSSQDKF